MASLAGEADLDSLVGSLMQQLKTNPPEWLTTPQTTPDAATSAAINAIASVQQQKKKPIQIIIAPGNGGCGRNIKKANWYGWFHKEMLSRGHDSICENWPDPNICHQSNWISYCINDLKADENTIVVGHSTGALLAMRLAETIKLKGIVLVAAAHTDLGDAGERASGYFDTDWDWTTQKKNAGFIHQFHSKDDHLIPVAEARYVANQLQGNNAVYEELNGYSHFFEPFQPLLDAMDTYTATETDEDENVSDTKETKENTKTETREMIYKYVAFGSFKQSKVQPCRHKTSLCPDRCTHAQKLYVFTLTDISVEPGTSKQRKFCNPLTLGKEFCISEKDMGTWVDVATNLTENDQVAIEWQHDYVTRNGCSGPERPVIRLSKLD